MPRKPALPGIDRRQLILEAALPVFAQQGFEAATNKEITERAGVNQGLIYFYFESKADLFFATFEHHARLVMAQLDAAFAQVGDEEPITGLHHLLRRIVEVLDTPRAISLLRLMHQTAGSRLPDGTLSSRDEQRSVGMLAEHLMTRLCDYLKTHIMRKASHPLKPSTVALLMTRTLVASIGARELDQPAQLSRAELAESIASLFCYGLLESAERRTTD